jgi:hypothetical protein
MPSPSQKRLEQEQSIKVRSHEVFVDLPRSEPIPRSAKPFPVYLRETPAQPLSSGIKTMIWMVAVIVALLFLAALWRITHRRATVRRPDADRPPAQEATVQDADGAHGVP